MNEKIIEKMSKEIKKLKRLGAWADDTPQYKIIKMWFEEIEPYLIKKLYQ